jgi:hypothetical protein
MICTALFDLHQYASDAGAAQIALAIWNATAAICGDF